MGECRNEKDYEMSKLHFTTSNNILSFLLLYHLYHLFLQRSPQLNAAHVKYKNNYVKTPFWRTSPPAAWWHGSSWDNRKFLIWLLTCVIITLLCNWWLTPSKYVFIGILLPWLCVWEDCIIILLAHGKHTASVLKHHIHPPILLMEKHKT